MVSQGSERKTLEIDPSEFIEAAKAIATDPDKIGKYGNILGIHIKILSYCSGNCRRNNCALFDNPENVYDTCCQVLKEAAEGNLSLRFIPTE